MSGKFKVDLEGLIAKVERMAQTGEKAEQGCEKVEAKVAQLSQSWQGEASAAHQTEHAQWKQGAQEMRDALAELKKLAQKAHGDYTKTVETNTKMWG